MRKRTQGSMSSTTHSWSKKIKNWNCSNSNSTVNQLYPFLVGEEKVMHDVVTKGFLRRSSQGEVIVNPMSINETKASGTPGTFSYYVTDDDPNTVCDYTHIETSAFRAIDEFYGPGRHQSVALDYTNLRALAGTKAMAGVEEPDFQSLVFIGELRETLRFLKNPVKSWSDFVRKAKRDKSRAAKRTDRLKTVGEFMSDSWLSYRYGARPLLSEAESALQAVHNTLHNVKPTRITSRGFAMDSGSHQTNSTTGSFPGFTWSRDANTEASVKVRAGVLYEHFAHSDTFGVGVKEIPSAMWELLPYSFVVDWFANVGTFVRAITPKVGVRYLGKWTTVETIQETSAEFYISDGGESKGKPRIITNNGLCIYKLYTRHKTRTPGVKVSLVTKVKPFRGDVGQKRIIDSIALTEQLLRSR